MAKKKAVKSKRAVKEASVTSERIPTSGAEETNVRAVVNGLLTKEEVAALLQITLRTLDRYIARGLPHLKLGYKTMRFDWAEIKEWLAAQFWVSKAN